MKNNNDNKREKLTLYKGHDGLGIFYCLKLGSSNTNENKDERENGGTSERVLRKREKNSSPFYKRKKLMLQSKARWIEQDVGIFASPNSKDQHPKWTIILLMLIPQ